MSYRKEISSIPRISGQIIIRTTEHGHAFKNRTVDYKLPDDAPTGKKLEDLLDEVRRTPGRKKIQNPKRLHKKD